MSEQLQKLLKVWQIAELLNASESFVYARFADGSLKHFVLGNGQGGLRCSIEQVQEYLKSREKGGVLPPPDDPALKHLTLP